MTRWIEPENVTVPPDLERVAGGDPLLAELLVRRGIRDAAAAYAFLDPDRYLPTSASALPDLNRGADLVERAIQAGKTICVWGDFDVDGQTATTLLVSTLEDLGGKVIYHIPVRAKESHGVNLPVLEKLIAGGIDLLLTCDTGISAHKEVDYAQRFGVKVVITDHHDLPATLPKAQAVVNPKRLPAGHPLRTLPGAGVAYKLAEALYERAGIPAAAETHLDLVALGIVADLAILHGDTRYLLQRGLQALRQTGRIGLLELMEKAGLIPSLVTEEHIGFALGPRLNALGRLSDANLAVELLTTRDLTRARILAEQLEGLNHDRKLLTEQIFEGAEAQLQRDPSLLDHAALVLAHPGWEPGVIGIVASRLVETYHRPTVLIASPPGEPARGSARSVDGIDISAAIAAQESLLLAYGGHPMAAGLALEPDRIDAFRLALADTINKMAGGELPEPALKIDGYLPLLALSLELVEDLERLAPFGPGNPPLTFASQGLQIKSVGALGRRGGHQQVIVEDQNEHTCKVFWWRSEGLPVPPGLFDLAYTVRAGTYQGQRELQVTWVEARVLEETTLDQETAQVQRQVVDHRRAAHPLPILQALRENIDLQVWAEAEDRHKVDGQHRDEIGPGSALAIWTTPPGQQELQDILAKTTPDTIYLFANDPGMDLLHPFLRRLAGVVKHALSNNDGLTDLAALAVATAQKTSVVRLGLEWLADAGEIELSLLPEGQVRLHRGSGEAAGQRMDVEDKLQEILKETAAFREYYRQAKVEGLIPGALATS